MEQQARGVSFCEGLRPGGAKALNRTVFEHECVIAGLLAGQVPAQPCAKTNLAQRRLSNRLEVLRPKVKLHKTSRYNEEMEGT